jgi:hypothetical protein
MSFFYGKPPVCDVWLYLGRTEYREADAVVLPVCHTSLCHRRQMLR